MKSCFTMRNLAKTAFAALVLTMLQSGAAQAACPATYPVGSPNDGVVSFLAAGANPPFIGPTTTQAVEAGSLVYNSADNTLQLCDNTAWRVLTTGAAGSQGQVQYNNSSVFAGDAEFVYDPANNQLVVGAASANGSAALEINSSNRGFLPPRMSTGQRDSIASPAEGLIIYNTTEKQMQYFNGTLWRPFGAVALGGNGLTSGSPGTSCKQILTDYGSGSAVYWVDPDATGPVAAFQVYCDMTTNGGGWMLVFRNNNTSLTTQFNQNWATYKAGFGDVTTPSSYGYIGNDRLNQLTVGGRELNVRDSSGTLHMYTNFSVGNETSKYLMSVTLTSSSNDANAPFTYHNGQKFTTSDQDNDLNAGNCATSYGAGWWYGSCHNMIWASNATGQSYWRNNSTNYTYTWLEFWIR